MTSLTVIEDGFKNDTDNVHINSNMQMILHMCGTSDISLSNTFGL